jgi:hypothetical protein
MVIEYPTKDGIKYFGDGTIYIKANDNTVNEWCSVYNYTLNSYTAETQRFSNDGALGYQYYGVLQGATGSTETWNTEFGFDKIVLSINVTPI